MNEVVRVKRKKRGGLNIVIVQGSDVRELRAANRRAYEKRKKSNKNARANVTSGFNSLSPF